MESISYTCSPGDVLGGILHPSVGTLANMTTLYIFGGCEVGGPLPAEVTKLSNLRVLTLWSNKFTGALPPLNNKDRFPFLYSLNVKKNAFSGAALDFRNSTGLLKVYEVRPSGGRATRPQGGEAIARRVGGNWVGGRKSERAAGSG